MQVFLIILCRKIIFWLLSSLFPILFLSFSYLQYNNKPKSQENASILSKNLLKMLTKGGKKLATNSHLIFSTLHFSPLFPTTQNFAPYLILLFIFITSIGASLFYYFTKFTHQLLPPHLSSFLFLPAASHINKFLLLFIILYIYYIYLLYYWSIVNLGKFKFQPW